MGRELGSSLVIRHLRSTIANRRGLFSRYPALPIAATKTCSEREATRDYFSVAYGWGFDCNDKVSQYRRT